MNIPGLQKTSKFHTTKRREVIASADVAIRQVQVIDKKGDARALIIWKCGPDVLYSESMDGLFDSARRRKAPDWLVEQLNSLPSDRMLNSDGESYQSLSSSGTTTPETAHIPTDDDLPSFAQG